MDLTEDTEGFVTPTPRFRDRVVAGVEWSRETVPTRHFEGMEREEQEKEVFPSDWNGTGE